MTYVVVCVFVDQCYRRKHFDKGYILTFDMIICMCNRVMVTEIVQAVKEHPATMTASKFTVVVVLHNLQREESFFFFFFFTLLVS